MFSPRKPTPQQDSIIQRALDSDLYVEAPAGHGKTTTAMLAAAEIAKSLPESLNQKLLVLTFSKMAVRQIDHETQQQVPRTLHSRILVSTYHSFYFALIRHYARYLGFQHTDFGLLTTEERKALYLLFSVSHPGLNYELFSCAQYLVAGISTPMPVEGDQPLETVAAAAAFLEEYHKNEHRIGFEDYPYYAYRVLADSSFVCDLVAHKYPVVFLDEFQNTNDLQWEILRCFVHNVRLVVFADPSQTIHGFRGAGNALSRFKQERNPVGISLTTNFRNSSSLHAFAKGIATGKFDADRPPNVTFHRLGLYKKDKWQLKYDIRNLTRSLSPSIHSIAVLTKENKHVAEVSEFLGRQTERTPSIPHEVVSPDYQTQDQENVVLALFHLIAACDPHHLVVVASALAACAKRKANYPFYLGQVVKTGECTPKAITGRTGIPGVKNARSFLGVVEPMIKAGPPDELHEAWNRTEQVLQDIRSIKTIPDMSEAFTRVKAEWSAWVAQQDIPTLETFMRHVMAQRRRRNFLEQRSYLRGVFIMTLHQSQGKQFDAVIIWRCNDGIIPHSEEISKEDYRPSQHLLYVGLTRARHFVRVYYEQNKYAQPSRLIQPFVATP